MTNSYELLKALHSLHLPIQERDAWWWPNSGTYEVVIGAVLTQNTKWQKVEEALENLRTLEALTIEGLAKLDEELLREAIKPAGFYNTKAKRLKLLNQAIRDKFGDFTNFQVEVSRRWLLEKKGVGEETADSILNYACYREAMVVDSYTAALLKAFGYEFEDYRSLQAWMIEGLKDYDIKVRELFPNIPKAQIYALFHGMIVEYCKQHKKGKKVDVSLIEKF
ncbi:3-methyladenine DNA glycosylase [Hydrogenimonas thermophila]|uniref:3-methyladenine DNA glycosylase n=1 Tax=Hydrogenimonas thermophila TaxID=223786 RepID=UPI00293709D3|nr:3-methyladenine DNA glycosylase [Hydrogenimonas thermophila]WOE70330.1 3-methyladenine DNA glycosylase [Hydrogenimonas thermophila]WOE72847.1 3-methyladenine DNA glycosylase [Hydrogenimonas thermophila]